MDLPTLKDVMALPTNMGLTLWDAVPIMASVAVAVGILLTQLPPKLAERAWRARRVTGVESIAFALLAAPLVAVAIPIGWLLGALLDRSIKDNYREEKGTSAPRLPRRPFAAALTRATEVVTSVAIGALLVGALDLLIRPYTSVPDLILVFIAGTILIAVRIGPAGATVLAVNILPYDHGRVGALVLIVASVTIEWLRTSPSVTSESEEASSLTY